MCFGKKYQKPVLSTLSQRKKRRERRRRRRRKLERKSEMRRQEYLLAECWEWDAKKRNF